MLFLEFLIIYFICIDTPIYDQPFSYQGTVLVIPLLHFYLFPPYPQQERRDAAWDELPPAPFYPWWSNAAPCYLLNAFIPPQNAQILSPKDSVPTPYFGLLITGCCRSSPSTLSSNEGGRAHTWARGACTLPVLWHSAPDLFSFGFSLWDCSFFSYNLAEDSIAPPHIQHHPSSSQAGPSLLSSCLWTDTVCLPSSSDMQKRENMGRCKLGEPPAPLKRMAWAAHEPFTWTSILKLKKAPSFSFILKTN